MDNDTNQWTDIGVILPRGTPDFQSKYGFLDLVTCRTYMVWVRILVRLGILNIPGPVFNFVSAFIVYRVDNFSIFSSIEGQLTLYEIRGWYFLYVIVRSSDPSSNLKTLWSPETWSWSSVSSLSERKWDSTKEEKVRIETERHETGGRYVYWPTRSGLQVCSRHRRGLWDILVKSPGPQVVHYVSRVPGPFLRVCPGSSSETQQPRILSPKFDRPHTRSSPPPRVQDPHLPRRRICLPEEVGTPVHVDLLPVSPREIQNPGSRP